MSAIYITSRWYVDYSLDRVEQISLELALYFRAELSLCVSVLQMFHHDAAKRIGVVVVVFVRVVIQSLLLVFKVRKRLICSALQGGKD